MNFQTIILQLGQGMLVTVEIFFSDVTFFVTAGTFGGFWKNVKKCVAKRYQ